MNQKKYINAVIKKLNCSQQKKNEIKRELEADIQTALVSGESWQEIENRMGDPSALSKEFNENLSDKEIAAARKTRRIVITSMVVILIGLIVIGIYWMLPRSYQIDDKSIYDNQEVISQAETIIELINQNDIETIQSQCANDTMKKVMDKNSINAAKEKIGLDWGSFQSYTSIYTSEIKQMGKVYAVAQITALYEHKSVTYTISFDKNMRLAGLYMK
jgi:hypothetical protein